MTAQKEQYPDIDFDYSEEGEVQAKYSPSGLGRAFVFARDHKGVWRNFYDGATTEDFANLTEDIEAAFFLWDREA